MARRRRSACGWFPLSDEARELLADDPERWEYVELADGPAAQALVPGVRPARAPPPEIVPEAPPEPEDPTGDLFGAETRSTG